jgi:hypothetical protein
MVNGAQQQLEVLRQIYIYSYAKALFYGLNSNNVRVLPVDSPIFVGHGIFHRLLQQSHFTLKDGDFSLNMGITIDEGSRIALQDQVLKDYSFLNNCIQRDVSGSFSFRSTRLDSVLSSLLSAVNKIDAYRMDVSQLKGNVRGQTQRVTENSDNSEISETYNSERFLSTEGNVSLKPGNRIVEIHDLSDPQLDSFLNDKSLPLGCSAIDSVDSSIWYYTNSRNALLKNQLSCFLCRGCFVYLKDGTNNAWFKSTYMDVLPKEDVYDIHLISEVRSLTYLRVNRGVSFGLDLEKANTSFFPLNSLGK